MDIPSPFGPLELTFRFTIFNQVCLDCCVFYQISLSSVNRVLKIFLRFFGVAETADLASEVLSPKSSNQETGEIAWPCRSGENVECMIGLESAFGRGGLEDTSSS